MYFVTCTLHYVDQIDNLDIRVDPLNWKGVSINVFLNKGCSYQTTV
jgi:hypothetical protein